MAIYAGFWTSTSENAPSRDCPKRVLGTLLAWIWPVHGGQNGSRSTVSAARRASLQAHPRLFGQSLEGVFSEVHIQYPTWPRPSSGTTAPYAGVLRGLGSFSWDRSQIRGSIHHGFIALCFIGSQMPGIRNERVGVRFLEPLSRNVCRNVWDTLVP